VGLAQALINDPEVVFLDEPMSGLDPIGRREVRDLISALRQEGKTVFMCSHILSDIEVLCDRVAILKGGRLAHVGFLDELRQQVEGRRDLVEVVVSGTDETTLKPHLPIGNEFRISATPAGLRIEVTKERDVDQVITALRKVSGKLISVQPLRQSLEDLFMD
ncbi:MAG: ABC transporter ATP-binding protein, partial [Acidobacteriota bacterium]|nr:ABC transporter ATP-binding protein [Acidobacteriota bacterium]